MSGDNLGSFDFPDFLNDNDTEIDRMIEERAGAHNLTGTNIRNILYVSLVCSNLELSNYG